MSNFSLLTVVNSLLEGNGGLEVHGIPGLADGVVELINLLKRETLGLIYEHVDEYHTNEAATSPDEEYLHTQVGVTWSGINHVWSSITDSEVKEPVGGGGDGQSFSTNLEGEQLSGNDPSDRSPRAGKEEDIEADKGNEDLVGDKGCSGNTDDGDDELTDAHTDGTEEEEVTTTHALNQI